MKYLQQLYPLLRENNLLILQLGLIILAIICLILLRKNRRLQQKLNNANRHLEDESSKYLSLQRNNNILSKECEKLSINIKSLKSEKSRLSLRNEDLQQRLSTETRKYNELLNQINDDKFFREKKRQEYYEQQKENESQQKYYIDIANQKLDLVPEQIICLRKKVFMNEDESRKYYHICEEFKDEAYTKKYSTKQIFVFAQVALHSIFARTQAGIELDKKIQDDYIRRFFLSKSIDYLVCATYYNEEKHYYEYKPILGIEVDGKYHEDPEVQKRDEQKERLFDAVGIPFLRFSLTENQEDRKAIRGKIRKLLLQDTMS